MNFSPTKSQFILITFIVGPCWSFESEHLARRILRDPVGLYPKLTLFQSMSKVFYIESSVNIELRL